VRTAAVGQADGRAGVVNEQLIAGAMNLTHGTLELFSEAPVIETELGV
jgi:hypothetical protein